MNIHRLAYTSLAVSIFTIFPFYFISGAEDCENQLTCLMEDPLGDIIRELITDCTENASEVEYWLYTPNNSIKLQPKDLIDSKRPVKILIHGWSGNRSQSYMEVIKNAYFQRYGSKRTIILVEYGMYANGSDVASYARAYCNALPVAMNVALFICNLHARSGIHPKDVHVIGHSLGAQVAGMAGKYLKLYCNRTLNRITGLDPAGPGFICPLCRKFRLDRTDAKFVDIIHTDVYLFGSPLQSGDVDFYANNGGPFQPGCFDFSNETVLSLVKDPLSLLRMPVSCSHQRSCYFFAESITLNSFLATSCWKDGDLLPECLYVDRTYMGEYSRRHPVYDSYEVKTKEQFPFGYGPRGSIHAGL